MRSIDFLDVRPFDNLDARHLIFADCWWFQASAGSVLPRFYQLETLVLFATDSYDLAWLLANLPPTIRRVHLMQQGIRIDQDHRNTSNVLLTSSHSRSHGSSHGRRANRRLLQMTISTRSPSCSNSSSRS